MVPSNNSSDKLIALLQLAYSGERAAAYAYRGHWHSVNDQDERDSIRGVEEDEWRHRELVGEMLGGLGAEPNRRREIDQSLQDAYRDLGVAPLACSVKASLNMLGFEVGVPRLPYVELDERELSVVRAMLERHGLLQTTHA